MSTMPRRAFARVGLRGQEVRSMIDGYADCSETGSSNRGQLASAMLNTASQLYRPGQSLQAYRLNDWLEFALWLDEVGILLPLVSVGVAFPFEPIKKTIRQRVAQYRARQDLINNELKKFSLCARENQLRFVSLKGSSLSTILYGSPYARQSTDIDILVEADDCDKADYTASLCGFKQPLEYCTLRDEKKLSDELDKRPFAPVRIRRRWDSDSLSEYVKVVDGFPVVMDVHDRLSQIGRSELQVFSWGTACVTFSGIKVNSLTESTLIAYLILASYDDSEGYAPNSRRGTLGLKLYYDLLASLFSMGEECFGQAIELLCSLGETSKAAKVVANLIDLFPEQFDFLSTAKIELPFSSYRIRFSNVSERRGIALADALTRLTGPQWCNELREGEEKEIRWNVCGNVTISARIIIMKNLAHVIWTVPDAVLFDIDCFVFQLRLNLRDSNSGIAEIRANLFSEGGEMHCNVVTSPCFSRSGKGDKAFRGSTVEVTELDCPGNSARYATAFDLGIAAEDAVRRTMLANGGVFKNHCGPIYREVWRDRMTIKGFSMLDVKL